MDGFPPASHGLPAVPPRGAVAVAGPTDTLFRNEVLEAKRNQWLGTVLLLPRLSTTLMTFAALALASAIIAFAFIGTYTRKARIEGWLVPQQGMSQVYAPQTGVVTALYVSEGMSVKKGAPLLDLSSDVQSQSVGSTVQEVVQKLKERRDTSQATLAAQNALYDQKTSDLKSQIITMQQQRDHLEGQITLQRQRLRVSENALKRDRQMQKEGIISLTRVQQSEQAHLEQLGMAQSLQRELSSLDSQIGQVRGSLGEIPMLRKTALGDIDRSIAQIDQEIAEAEARRQTVLEAPQDGIVTALTIEQGGRAFPNTPLLSSVPQGASLDAQLFSPSRAIGFVKEGQDVQLRYQPFPYQKFGLYGGKITSISRSPMNPADLPRQFAKASAVEPVFRVTVKLDRQSVQAYGEAIPLQAGMELEADVQLETRSLFEWVLDPLYTLTGRKQP